MKNKVFKGTILLIISGFICKILGAFFRIPLSEIIGAEGIGLFQLIMPVYSFVLVLISGGITTGLSRLISKARAKGDISKINALFKCAVIYTFSAGLVAFILFILLSKSLSSLQGSDKLAISYIAISIAIIFAVSESAFRGYYQGYENMFPTAVSQILEQVIKLIAGILLSYLLMPYGVAYGVFGAILGITISEVISTLFLIIYMHFKRDKVNLIFDIKDSAKELFKTSGVLTLGSIIIPLTNLIESICIVPILIFLGFSSTFSTALFGVANGMVGALVNMPIIISISIAVSMLPAISYKLCSNKIEEGYSLAGKALKIVWLIVLPASVGLVAIAPELLSVLYPSLIEENLLSFAVNILYILSGTIVFTSMMQVSSCILQAQGRINLSVINLTIGGVIKIVLLLGLTYIRSINIYSVAISSLAMSSIITIINLFCLKKVNMFINLSDLLVPPVAAVLMGVAVFFTIKATNFSNFISCLVAGLLGIILYLIFAYPILKKYIKRSV